jgi:hypothetical protein
MAEGATEVMEGMAVGGKSVKFLTFRIPPGGVPAVRLVASSKQTRKGFELRDSIWRRNRCYACCAL